MKALATIIKELDGLSEQKVFKIIAEKDIQVEGVLLPSRTTCAIKNLATLLERFKGSLQATGHKDSLKNILINDTSNLKQHKIKLFLFT